MSILIIGPEGGQLATWPIRVMVSANKAARLTVPEEMPPYGAGFAGKLFYGGVDGTVTPLGIGEGVEIVRQEDGAFVLVAYGGAGGGGGTAGAAPTVTVEQTETGATITATDSNGTTVAQIRNGADGPPGERGPQGKPGEDYVLTGDDRQEIAAEVLAALPTWTGGAY